jgi:Rps23 Pro-64 3,4-dihydroxylase Tpa1-like proline 4-hydroxylase
MRLTESGERYVVYDDFLSPSEFEHAASLMRRADLAETYSVISAERDGPAHRSRGMSFSARIGDEGTGGRPPAFKAIAQAVRAEARLFGEAGVSWDKLTYTFWQYPAGSRLGWHNDAGRGRQGEFIVYLHPEWDISWGGELLLFDREPRALLEMLGVSAETIEALSPQALLDEILRTCEASPLAVLPRPNRLVMVKANTVHTVRRVDHTAGSHRRCTLTGFVYADEHAENEAESARAAARNALLSVADR